MGRNTGMPTGRPYIYAYDGLGKACLRCGQMFYLRDREFQSLGRFKRRKYCSVKCADEAKVVSGSDEFWSQIGNCTPDTCWEFPGQIDRKGYGQTQRHGKKWRAHRLAYVIANGEIPDGLMVIHSCDNRKCCNPHHLRAGTAKDNFQDAMDRHRMPHVLPIEIPATDLTKGTAQQVADRFGVCINTVYRKRAKLR